MTTPRVKMTLPALHSLAISASIGTTVISTDQGAITIGTPDIPALLTGLHVAYHATRQPGGFSTQLAKTMEISWEPRDNGWRGEAGPYIATIERFSSDGFTNWMAWIADTERSSSPLAEGTPQLSYSLPGAMAYCVDRLLMLLERERQ